MSFGGSVQQMINSIKQNAALKTSRRSKFKGGNSYSNIKNTKTKYDIPKLSKTELEKVKRQIQEEAKQENRKHVIYWIIGAITVLISILIFNYINF
jgi:hypothetical protein